MSVRAARTLVLAANVVGRACRNHGKRNEAIWDAAPGCARPGTICRTALDTSSANQLGGQRYEIVALQAVA